MRRFWKGVFWGFLVGSILAWLWQQRLRTFEPNDFIEEQAIPLMPDAAPPVQEATPTPRPRREAAPPDDFTVLRGIGPAFARRLQQAGIHYFTQLASLTPEAIAELCDVPLWRIRQDNWIGQATAQVR